MNYLKFWCAIALLTLISTTVTAGEIATVKVEGMVCDFCARSFEKVLLEQPQVASINVDLDASDLTIWFNKRASLTDAAIISFIEDAGYSVATINRSVSH